MLGAQVIGQRTRYGYFGYSREETSHEVMRKSKVDMSPHESSPATAL